MSTALDAARQYLAAGLSVVPIRPDGSKSPSLAWKPLQRQRATDAMLLTWFAGDRHGPAVVCGAVSDHLELLDFETAAAWESWSRLLAGEIGVTRDSLTVVRTPGHDDQGGRHVWYRCPGLVIPGNTKLALMSPEEASELTGDPKKQTLIETRGEGGYALVPGCPPACHPTGRTYEHLSGPPIGAALVSPEDRELLWQAARALTWVPPLAAPPAPPDCPLTPGNDYDRRPPSWGTILEAHGWTLAARAAGRLLWRRPGKDRGWSATTGHCHGKGGVDLLHVFSSNAGPFEAGKSYGPFRTYAILNHGGDLSAAARELARQGYGGGPRPKAKPPEEPPPAPSAPSGAQPPQPAPFPDPIPASQLRAVQGGGDVLWDGYLYRGEVTLFTALWKVGKTTLLAHLLRAFERGGDFCGRTVRPGKVLYVTEETEGRWAQRRDQLGIADHVEFLVRPFPGRPDFGRWMEFLWHLKALIGERSYDVVTFDTFANLWPIKDENDAAQTQAALMPLHALGSVGTLGVHHNRKSDGMEATAARGSGALSGFVDTIIECRRYNAGDRKDRRRVLTGYGRHDETPEELVVELTEAGQFVPQGDRDMVRAVTLAPTLLSIMPGSPPGMSADEVLDAWTLDGKPGRQQLYAALHAGLDARLWRCQGSGKRGDPRRYWQVPAADPSSISSPYRDGDERPISDDPIPD